MTPEECLDDLYRRAHDVIERGVSKQDFAKAVEQFGEVVVEAGIEKAENGGVSIVSWGYVLKIFETVRKQLEPVPMQNHNPGPKTVPLTREQVLRDLPGMAEMARTPGFEGRLGLNWIHGHIVRGVIAAADVPVDIREKFDVTEPAQKEPAAGRLAKVPPQPVGALDRPTSSIVHATPDESNDTCEIGDFGDQGQRARQDSNLQPSDSKSEHASARPVGGHVRPALPVPVKSIPSAKIWGDFRENRDRASDYQSEGLSRSRVPRGSFYEQAEHQRE